MARPSWRTPALVLAFGSLILIISNGLRANSGLYLQPMTMDQGWTREAFSLAIALQNLLWGLSGPFFGAVADKYGAGRTVVTGGILLVLGYYGMSQAQTTTQLFATTGALVGFGISGTGLAVVLAVFARQFDLKHRSIVMGVGTAAGSMGQFVMLPVGQAWIGAYGWQQALVLQALLCLLIIPLAAALAGRPQAREAAHHEESVARAIGTASRDASFILLFLGYFTCGFQVVFIALHLPAYLVGRGLDAELGATALALVGLFNIIGSLTSGWLGGRYSKKYLLSGLYLCRSIVIALFVFLPLSAATVYLFAALIGLLWLSTVPLTTGLIGHIYGLRYLSTLSGIVFLGHQVGSFMGAWLGGKIYDATGSYEIAWWLMIAAGVYAAIMHLPIREAPLATRTKPAAA